MYPVPWCDALEIIPSGEAETTLTVTGSQMEADKEKNLCYRAWKLMAETCKIPSVHIHLHKVIPTGAGLGGGSSDASFTLRMLNKMFHLNLSNEILRSLAVQLGMDCPFFIENIPALSTGRGEFLQSAAVNLDGLYLVIVKPAIHVSTAAAFTGIKPVFRENSIAEIAIQPFSEWKHILHNDFETTVFDLYPEIEDIKNKLYRQGARYASLTGSGSAVYGIFTENPGKVEFPDFTIFQVLLGSKL